METIHRQKIDDNLSSKYDDVKFDPERAKKLREQESRKGELPLRERFSVDASDYPIFAGQCGVRYDKILKKNEERRLNIDETLGIMVGDTAETIAVINGEDERIPAADHVIYLDKSARPVSWLVNEFWEDFADRAKPEESFLAIDRRQWFPKVGIQLEMNEQIRDENGDLRVATGIDFWRKFDELSDERKKDYLARIRGLYIEGGIESEDPDMILSTPTKLDGKNLLIVDEVSRSGSTLDIAMGLMKRAIPELNSVNGHVFWKDVSVENNETRETQMGMAPVWYPGDSSDWRGRGVKDINTDYYRRMYEAEPNKKTRAEMYGAFVLGEPLIRKEDEPGQLSWKLRDEIKEMHQDYQDGRILPNIPVFEKVADKIISKLEGLGVEFVPPEEAKGNQNVYSKLIEYRNRVPE